MAHVALVIPVAGCLNGSGSDGAGTITGNWIWKQGDCSQFIGFDSDGQFSFGTDRVLGENTIAERVDGHYSTAGTGGGLTVDPGDSVRPELVAYCAQSQLGTLNSLPLEELSSGLGLPLQDLTFRIESSPAQGLIAVGTAPDRTDRVALFHRSGRLLGARLDGTPHFAGNLYASPPGDPARTPELPFPRPVINLPEQIFAETIAASVGALRTIVLNMTATAEVAFSVVSPDTTLPSCSFELYSDLDLGTVLNPSPLEEQWLSLHPGEGASPLIEYSVVSDSGISTAYLLPLVIKGNEIGECQVTITARSTAASVLDAIVADPAFQPLLEVTLPADVTDPADAAIGEAIGLVTGHPERARRLRWHLGLIARGFSALPEKVGAMPPLTVGTEAQPPDFDLLGLTRGEATALSWSVGQFGGESFLNIFSESGSTGLGPFLPAAPPGKAKNLALPGVTLVSFGQANTSQSYEISLTATRRVAIWSEGADAYATLGDSQNRVFASDDNGAADGEGFRFVRTLTAGKYILTVTSRDANANLALHLEAAGPRAVPDEELEACLIANGLERLSPGDWRVLSCAGQGIRSLQGLAGIATFQELELAGNRIENLAPLVALTQLRVLSLSGNSVRHVQALASLSKLHSLSLAYNPVEPGALDALAALANSLRSLDLTGIVTVPAIEIALLRASLPNTLIITPQGTQLP